MHKLLLIILIIGLLLISTTGCDDIAKLGDTVSEWFSSDTPPENTTPPTTEKLATTTTAALTSTPTPTTEKALSIGKQVLDLVNDIRVEKGITTLSWDDTLYKYSLAHSTEMAKRRDLFHSDINMAYAENAWGGEGSRSWGASTIVNSWMNSSKHRTWLLCPHLKHVAVGVAYSSNGMYASWTFWRNETVQSDWWYQYSPDNPPSWWY